LISRAPREQSAKIEGHRGCLEGLCDEGGETCQKFVSPLGSRHGVTVKSDDLSILSGAV
jgi:hypothetical protein